MGTVEKFLILLFTAIIVGLVLTNPKGVTGFFTGIATFTSKTVGAFTGFSGGGSSISSANLPSLSMY